MIQAYILTKHAQTFLFIFEVVSKQIYCFANNIKVCWQLVPISSIELRITLHFVLRQTNAN